MLYPESRKRSKKSYYQIVAFSALFLLYTACGDTATTAEKPQQEEVYSSLRAEQYVLNLSTIRSGLEQLFYADNDSSEADRLVRHYYRDKGALIWINKQGITSEADSMLTFLRKAIVDMGFSTSAFHLDDIENGINRFRTLDFTDEKNASKTAAKTEYLLTKAYVRYVVGQRFGFVNPTRLLNHLVPKAATDSVNHNVVYQSVYDIATEHPDNNFVVQALEYVSKGQTLGFMTEQETQDSLYHRLKSLLPSVSGAAKEKVLVNMERQRWRTRLERSDRYVLVNIAAYHLWAVSPDTVIDMRIGCGAMKTRTPLLTSTITHIEVNPEWVIPMSIVKTDIARHAGDSTYFIRRNYYIAERSSGKRLSPVDVTSKMLLSGQYKVVQEGGDGNALGRIIFRFANNYSVFLHHTSSPSFFENSNRSVSHGCVRVQHPFDLARFMLPTADEWQLDKLRLAMGLSPESIKGKQYADTHTDEEINKLVRWLKVEPGLPLIISYHTIFPNPRTGQLEYYPDVYGYDKAIARSIKLFRR